MPIRSPRLGAMRTAFRAVGAVAPGVAARWAETLFCTPPRRPGGDQAFLASGSRFTIESQGRCLTGWERGSGPTVILVHGWGSRASPFGARGGAAAVRVFSDHFARTLAIAPLVQQTMHRNLERRLRIVWDDLHLPTLVRGRPAPALVIHDRDDADVPFTHGEANVGAWAGSRLETTTGLGHRAILRDPAVIGRTVAFLGEGMPG